MTIRYSNLWLEDADVVHGTLNPVDHDPFADAWWRQNERKFDDSYMRFDPVTDCDPFPDIMDDLFRKAHASGEDIVIPDESETFYIVLDDNYEESPW